ncbi:MAG TPA: beta-RFAP synthase, partial [Planctomycetota bacterium]|nr:beta-RFAP synthase [Planctomycetota bacterium]
MIRVRTGSRIHLGLIAPAGIGSRVHGGCGFMVEEPGIELVLSPAESFETEGPLASRARGFAEAWAESEGGLPLPPVRITIDRAPQDHLGLGTGTQLGLATAAALST